MDIDSPLIVGYRLGQRLAPGSRTLIYRGIQLGDGQPVVLKFLKGNFPTLHGLLRLQNHYTIAKNLNLAGVVQPLDLVPYGHGLVLVMPDEGSGALSDYITDQALHPLEALAIALQLTRILHDLAKHRVIHKDIKPANILIHPETKQVKLIDFSIASLLPRETQDIQNPTVLEGTLAYMAPEQTGRMNRGIDYRSDFYAFGVTLFELLTGQLPFQADDPMELLHCHLTRRPPEVHSVNPAVPPILSAIVGKLMAKNAEDRYQSALGVQHDLVTCRQQMQATAQPIWFTLGQRDTSDRFLIPEQLYGRESEVIALLSAFNRVSTGASELLLVAGFSGIGKTAVVNEVHKPIVRQRGYFIKGKFDQFNRNMPFFAFVQAFRDLIAQLLSENDAQLDAWKIRILAAVGENGQVMIDVIPELEQIIGPQAAAPQLSGNAAQHRFNRLFQKFVQVFTTPEHPLVVFLDDLQWADSAALQLLDRLLQNMRHLLILGAYRDNEVSPVHPLMLAVHELKKAGAPVNTMLLPPLSQSHINQLVADTLRCDRALAEPLTDLVYQKTQGNPFFTTQFLKALHYDESIQFNRDVGDWQCDISQIKVQSLTNDVVTLMVQQLQRLPAATQAVLKLAACIGNQFDLQTLAIVCEQSDMQTGMALWSALQAGLIMPLNQIYKFFQAESGVRSENASERWMVDSGACTYRFRHDRVQQAAYSLIPDHHKQLTHRSIGQLLLRDAADHEQAERLFEIVNHLNVGVACMTSPQEREKLAELNLAAGRKAKTATAYAAAIVYLGTGIELLPADAWKRHYPLTLALHEDIAEASYLNTEFESMARWAEVVLQQAQTLLDTSKVQQTRILGTSAQGQALEAIQIGLQMLRSLGIEFPEQPTQSEIEQAFGLTRSLWADQAPGSLLDLPTMQDLQSLTAMEILTILVPSTYAAAPALMPLLIFKQVELSIQSGNCPLSVFAYGDYGLILCGIMDDIENGYAFGELALTLCDRYQLASLQCRNWYVVHLFIKPWKTPTPLSELLPGLQAAYQSGLETGELEMACRCALSYCYYAYHAGQGLTELAQTMEAYRQTIHQYKQVNILDCHVIYQQTVLNLLGQSEVPYCLTGALFNQEQGLPQLQAANNRSALFFWYMNQTILYYLFGQEREAAQTTVQTAQYLEGGVGLFMIPLYSFFDALIQLTQYAAAAPAARQAILLNVQQHHDKLHHWATLAPSNHQHRCELIAAERDRILGNKADAIEAYDRAIASAKANHFIQDEALANELAAKFYLNWGKEKVAASYMQEAYSGYARWGATAKTDDLEQRYPHLLRSILQNAFPANSLGTTTVLNQSLDIASVFRGAQAISEEIILERLLTKLMQVILATAGATKGILLLPKNDQMAVVAVATHEAEPVLLVPFLPMELSQDLPLTVVNLVCHRRELLILDEPRTHATFAADPYWQHGPSRSVLCMPLLKQGHLTGILYLENQLTTGAFTRDRRETLTLLCTQAAISLENAQLYQQSQSYAQQLEDVSKVLRDDNLRQPSQHNADHGPINQGL